jgi:hypothetical protein
MSASRDRSMRLRVLVVAAGFGGCIGIGFGYHLAEEIVWPLFWSAWLLGISIAYFYYAFGRGRPTTIVAGWHTFWEAVGQVVWRCVVRGSLLGGIFFAAAAFVNCQFAVGPTVRSEGTVVAKGWSSSRTGRSYHLIVRDALEGYTFKCAVGGTPYDLTRLNARWSLTLRRGCFGWPFRVD